MSHSETKDKLIEEITGGNEDKSASSLRLELMIEQSVMEFINNHINADTSSELGGMMFGRVARGDGFIRVDVTGAVEARYTETEQANIKFTPRTWHYMEQARVEKYPDLEVVGWFHSHPGKGVYLSTYHTFIHHNFFDQPWQIALVMDPLDGTHGFFGWTNGKIARLQYNLSGQIGSGEKNDGGQGYVFNLVEQYNIAAPWTAQSETLPPGTGRTTSPAHVPNEIIWLNEADRTENERGWLLSVCVAGILMLAFSCGFLGWNTLNLQKSLEDTNKRLAFVELQVKETGRSNEPNNAEGETAAGRDSDTDGDTKPEGEQQTGNSRGANAAGGTNDSPDTGGNDGSYESYTVKDGDNFWLISNNVYKSGMYYREIAQYNGLSENATLQPGQVIKIPPLNTQ